MGSGVCVLDTCIDIDRGSPSRDRYRAEVGGESKNKSSTDSANHVERASSKQFAGLLISFFLCFLHKYGAYSSTLSGRSMQSQILFRIVRVAFCTRSHAYMYHYVWVLPTYPSIKRHQSGQYYSSFRILLLFPYSILSFVPCKKSFRFHLYRHTHTYHVLHSL